MFIVYCNVYYVMQRGIERAERECEREREAEGKKDLVGWGEIERERESYD